VTITIHGSSNADRSDSAFLATGTPETSDFVDGSPGGDSIAAGGSEGQIILGGADTINGTGNTDVHPGSGKDTIKGHGGYDTIYGGSGSDIINASHGDDSGFGADQL